MLEAEKKGIDSSDERSYHMKGHCARTQTTFGKRTTTNKAACLLLEILALASSHLLLDK